MEEYSAVTDNLQVEIIGRQVHCPRDMLRWECSEALSDIVAFVERMNVVGKQFRSSDIFGEGNKRSEVGSVEKVMDVLWNVGVWAEDHEPAINDLFTVTSFGHFYDTLHVKGYAMLIKTYERRGDHRTVELPVYLEKSFGDPKTLTYGPENELSFCMFLVALFKLHHLTFVDEPYVVAVIFDRYLDVVEFVIKSYRLKPSLKRGNHGLNDYRYLGFLWGSAQLSGDEGILGLSLAVALEDVNVARKLRTNYVFMKCMNSVHSDVHRTFMETKDCGDVNEVVDEGKDVNEEMTIDEEDVDEEDVDEEKDVDEEGVDMEVVDKVTGMMMKDGKDKVRRQRVFQRPLWYHSYQLWNLKACPSWNRVNRCLMTAFQRDVLNSFEVVSHLAFGELLKFTRNSRPAGMLFYDCKPLLAAARSDITPIDTHDDGDGRETEDDKGIGDDRGVVDDVEIVDAKLLSHYVAEEFE